MRVALTGCSGYIGSRLALRLAEAGARIIGIDRTAPAAGAAGLDSFVEADLVDPGRYADALRACDLICHLAAAKGDWGISEAEYHRDNVDATRQLIAAAEQSGVERWMFYSTVSTLGPSTTPLPEDSPRRPVNAYGRSKAKCEELFESYLLRRPAAHVVNIRPSVVYGPENPENTNVFRLIDAVWRNRFVMIGDGAPIKTTSFIDNLLDAHMFLMERQQRLGGSGLHTYHYVDEPPLGTAQLVRTIAALLGKPPPRLRLPLAIASPLALVGDVTAAATGIDLPITSARVRKFCTGTNFSSEKIRRLGFVQAASNEEALRLTVEWYLEQHVTRRPSKGGRDAPPKRSSRLRRSSGAL